MLSLILATLIVAQIAPSPSPTPCATATPTASPNMVHEPCTIASVKAKGRIDNLIGTVGTASEGNVSYKELEQRPILRPGELLETVPGLVISQHSGEGKANQYYLRGFNLDHGTDIAVTVDGVPANMRTHAHGQGYADINWVIPELVSYLNYRKGPYFADEGDFSTAGAVNIYFFNTLPKALYSLEAGAYGRARVLFADSPRVMKGAHLLYALEYLHTDNTGDIPDNYRKYNTFFRYSKETPRVTFNVTVQSYDARWHSTDQIPLRAVQSGLIDRFGQIDSTDGGQTHRYVVSSDFLIDNRKSRLTANAYAMDYGLRLYSDFTYFLEHPELMDQFEQQDQRTVTGFNVANSWIASAAETTLGVQVRNDNIAPVSLYGTRARQIVQTKRSDHVVENSTSIYVQSNFKLSARLRATAGLRTDIYNYRVRDANRLNSGDGRAAILTPKASIAYRPSDAAEFYLNYGQSFHSNDARGFTETRDPQTGAPTDSNTGLAIGRSTPLVRATGAEVGARLSVGGHLRSTVSIWTLRLGSELVFSGDAGTTAPGRPSNRSGIEFSNFWVPTTGVTVDADYARSSATFTDVDPAGNLIPGSLQTVFSLGYTIDRAKAYGSVRLRYFGPRPLIEDGSVYSHPTTTVSLQSGLKLSEGLRLGIDVFNLLDTKSSDIDYYYNSYVPSDPYYTNPRYAGACPPGRTCGQGVPDVHFHPIERRTLRFTLSKRI